HFFAGWWRARFQLPSLPFDRSVLLRHRAGSESGVVARRHLHEDHRPEEHEADDGARRDPAPQLTGAPPHRVDLAPAAPLRQLALERLHQPHDPAAEKLSSARPTPMASAAAMAVSRKPAPARRGPFRRQSANAGPGSSRMWPRTWSVISANQAMKLTLC